MSHEPGDTSDTPLTSDPIEVLERSKMECEHELPPVIDIASAGKRRPARNSDYGADEPEKPPPWQRPEPLADQHLRPVPPFDLDLLPIDLRGWVADIAERMQVAPDLVAISAMCALGVVAASARTIYPKRYDNWRVWTNLWGAAVAPAGSMKTPAAAAVERVLNEIERQAREDFEQQMLGATADEMVSEASRKALKAKLDGFAKGRKGAEQIDRDDIVKALRQTAEEQEARPRMRRIKASDTTIEALIDRASRGKRRCQPIVVWRDELVGLFAAFDRDGHESDRKLLMEGWGVSTISVDRIGRGTLYARDFAISIFGCVTPGAFGSYVREATDQGSGADGFLQRLQLLVYPDQPATWTYVDRTPDRVAERRALALYERLFAIDADDDLGRPPALNFDEDAQAFFDEWIAVLEYRLRDPRKGWDDEARRSHFAKYRSLMPALALLCHLASGDGTQDLQVTLDAADRAARWCEYLEAHAERVYAMNDRTIEEVLVNRISSGKLVGTISLRALHRKLWQSRKAEDVREACEELERHGWLRIETVKGERGRPSQVVVINPLIAPGLDRA